MQISIKRDDTGQPVAMYFSLAPDIQPVPKFKRGDRVRAFDSEEWRPIGDVGDNSRFWKPATVLRCYQQYGKYLVDLLFDCGRISRAHFAYGVKPIVSDG